MSFVGKHINRLKKSINKRYSPEGTTYRILKNADYIEQLIVNLPEKDASVTYWKKAYLTYFHAHIEHYRKGKYLPKFILRNLYPKIGWYDFVKDNSNCIKDGILNLNGIYFPVPDHKDFGEDGFGSIIIDVLLQHLLQFTLEDIKNMDYKFYLVCPEGPYEYNNVFLNEGDIVIDAGACIGDFSALASYKKCTSYAFEALSFVQEKYLSKTMEMNKGIILAPYALSDKKKEIEFVFHTEEIGSSFISDIGRNAGQKKKEFIYEKVQAIDLDSFVNQENLEKVDFIKADIEGAERDMLKGAQSVLKEFSPKLALCTYHLPDDPEVMKELILQANPKYIIEQEFAKLYAYVPK